MQAHEQAETETRVADFHGQLGTSKVRSHPNRAWVLQPPFKQTAISRLEGRQVARFPEQLRMHRALEELGWTGALDELNDTARLKEQFPPELVPITTEGTILAGFERWQLALSEGWHEIPCIEYHLSEDESLHFILFHYRPRRGWNAFVRIRLALKLEPYLQQKALENMRSGGEYKGSASLPDVQRIDVRQEIARAAGVGARNVSNVKTILQTAHPRLIEALRDGALTINRAFQWCEQPKAQQIDEFTQYTLERATSKVICPSVNRLKKDEAGPAVWLQIADADARCRP